ncbi:MAG: L-threonylcarbamoyladenylate synthase [Alphaproteobacteria bacterium]|nr:L-threonylcarbamoyladenylate synthase [Alphaproteobacteria bacterium]
MVIAAPTDTNIEKAAGCLKDGGLVAMPTETVYGLAADATNDEAVARVFEAKGRPQFNPLITHYTGMHAAAQDVVFNSMAEQLATLFWPGPLTLVLPRRADTQLSLLTSAGLPTQAVRCPAHPVAQKLIDMLGRPIAAPSANMSGTLSPTAPMHVQDSLGDKVDMILAGGKSAVGLESTVMDVTGDKPVILRHGVITKEDIERHMGETVIVATNENTAPKSPGQLLKHYAPKTALRLKAVDVGEGEALLAFGSTRFMGQKQGGGLKGVEVLNLSETGDLHQAAANLFSMLHQLDAGGYKSIAVMDVPQTGLGLAINDRLQRAVAGK